MPSDFDVLVEQLKKLYDEGEARSIARIVFEDVFHTRQHRQAQLKPEQQAQLRIITDALLRGEPVQYILGEADFYGLKWGVSPDVLIPRQETEELVALALDSARKAGWLAPRILDIGTGSGCIAVTLQYKLPAARVSAVDVSAAALEIARQNARRHAPGVAFQLLDILDQEKWSALGSYEMIVSNPPYIPPAEKKLMPARVTEYEPHLALFVPEADPLLFYEKITAFADLHLETGGCLLFEINEFRAAGVRETLERAGFSEVEVLNDLAGAARMIRAVKP